MPTYDCTVKDKAGRSCTERVEAADAEEAEFLVGQGDSETQESEPYYDFDCPEKRVTAVTKMYD